MIEMKTLTSLGARFRWLIVLVVVAVVAYVARAFGSSSKQEKYKEIIEDFKDKKLIEIIEKEEARISKRDDMDSAEINLKVDDMERVRKETASAIDARRKINLGMREVGEALNK